MVYRCLAEDDEVALKVPGKIAERIWTLALEDPADEAGVQVFDIYPSAGERRVNVMHTHANAKLRSWHQVYGRFEVEALRITVSYEEGGYVMKVDGARTPNPGDLMQEGARAYA